MPKFSDRFLRDMASETKNPAVLAKLLKSKDFGLMLRAAGNKHTPPDDLDRLADHRQREVAFHVASNPGAHSKTLDKLSTHDDFLVRKAVAKNPNTKGLAIDNLLKRVPDYAFQTLEIMDALTKNPNLEPRHFEALANRDAQGQLFLIKHPSIPDSVLNKLASDEGLRSDVIAAAHCEIRRREGRRKAPANESVFTPEFLVGMAKKTKNPAVLRKLSYSPHVEVLHWVARNDHTHTDDVVRLARHPSPVVGPWARSVLVDREVALPKESRANGLIAGVLTEAKFSKHFLNSMAGSSKNQDVLRKLANLPGARRGFRDVADEITLHDRISLNPDAGPEVLDQVSRENENDFIIQYRVVHHKNVGRPTLQRLTKHSNVIVSSDADHVLGRSDKIKNEAFSPKFLRDMAKSTTNPKVLRKLVDMKHASDLDKYRLHFEIVDNPHVDSYTIEKLKKSPNQLLATKAYYRTGQIPPWRLPSKDEVKEEGPSLPAEWFKKPKFSFAFRKQMARHSENQAVLRKLAATKNPVERMHAHIGIGLNPNSGSEVLDYVSNTTQSIDPNANVILYHILHHPNVSSKTVREMTRRFPAAKAWLKKTK